MVAAICRQSHESNSLRSDAIYRKLFNNDMQYLIEYSEKIVRDPQIVMDSVMDISVFEVSITLFKCLYISILRCVVHINRDG